MWRHFVLWLALVVTLGCWTLTTAQDDNIYSPPDIKVPRMRNTEYVGTRRSIQLVCAAAGVPVPRYTWRYKGGSPLQDMELPRTATFDEVTGNLTVTDLTEREEGEYQCLAFSDIQPGQRVTDVAPAYTLKAIVLNPWTVVAKTTTVKNTGEAVTLTCENPPRSQPEGSFKWFEKDKNRKEIRADDRVHIDTKGNLHFLYLLANDTNEELNCGVLNEELNTLRLGSPRKLQVVDGPLRQFSPSLLYYTGNVTAMRNRDVELECIFSGYEVPSVSWFDQDNRTIAYSEKYLLSGLNRKLTIHRVQEDDQGMYTCRGENSAGVAIADIHLQVVSRPIPVQVFYDETKPEFTDVTLPCKTRNANEVTSPISTPVWSKNGEPFTADGVKYRYNSDETELTIVNITKPADISCYLCEVSNEYGTSWVDGCLNVINPIRLTEVPPLEQRITKGDTVNLTIRATTDVSMRSSLKTRAVHNGKWYEYCRKERPPFMTYDSLTQVAYINTSGLSDEDYREVNGTYTLEVYHNFEIKSVDVLVLLEDVIDSLPTTSTVEILPSAEDETSTASFSSAAPPADSDVTTYNVTATSTERASSGSKTSLPALVAVAAMVGWLLTQI